MKLLYQLTNDVFLNEMNNLQGSFNLRVSSAIDNVSFADKKMSQQSSFEITKTTSSNAKQLQSNEETIIHARNSVNISPKSKATIKNLQLDGTLNMYDDSI